MTANENSKESLMAGLVQECSRARVYASFAERADEEGYRDMALLFSALARSEQIRTKLISECLPETTRNSGVPGKPARVSSTAENLNTTIVWKTHALGALFPGCLAAADSLGPAAFAGIVQSSIDVTEEQLRICRIALENIQNLEPCPPLPRAGMPPKNTQCDQLPSPIVGLPWFWMRGFKNSIPVRIASRTPYLVCSRCGFTTEVASHQRCHGCSATVCCGCICSRALRIRISAKKKFSTRELLKSGLKD